MESPITIRRLAPRDADAILAIQSQCPELAQWSKQDYEAMSEGNSIGWVASPFLTAAESPASPAASAIAGFITARLAADEVEILNLGVSPEQRRRGIAEALLNAALEWARENRARQVFLEVRVSNNPAIQFYKKAGFHPIGRRANYYTSPVEDALQLAMQIR